MIMARPSDPPCVRSNMRRQVDPLADVIRTAVARYTDGMLPVDADVWPQIRDRLAARRIGSVSGSPMRVHRARGLGAGIVLCLLLGAVSLGTVAASTPTPDALVAAVGRFAAARFAPAPAVVTLAPAPPFRVLNLGYVPPGLTRQVVYYVPACSRCQTVAMATRGYAPGGPRAGCDAGSRNGECLLLGVLTRTLRADRPGHVAELYIGFADPTGTAYVDMVERAERSGGDAGARQGLSLRSGVTVLTLRRESTLLELRTDLGQQVAMRMASSLR